MELFDEKAEVEERNAMDSMGKKFSGKGLLARILWNQSATVTYDVKIKGKRQVRYHPIMVCFAIILRSKMNRGTYDFVSKVFNLP